MDADVITRRTALARFALLAGGTAMAGAFPGIALGAPPAAGLTPQRRRVLAALVETFDGIGPIRVRGRNIMAELVQAYDQNPPENQERMDALIDAVDAAVSGTPFSDRSPAARRAVIQGWLTASDPDDTLLQRARASDASEPASLAESNAKNLALCEAQMAKIPEREKRLDPTTGLLVYEPPQPRDSPPPLDPRGPLGTPVRLRRALAHDSYVLLASLFGEDVRYATVRAR